MNPLRLMIESQNVLDYLIRPPLVKGPYEEEVIILLHGYAQHGKKIYRDLLAVLPETSWIFAPNGLYPLPYRTDDGFKVANGWYFYDGKKDEYFIDFGPAVSFLKKGIEELRARGELPANASLQIVGFSQGGYLAPQLGLALFETKKVICAGAALVPEELPHSLPFQIHTVIGEADEVIDFVGAKKSFDEIISRGNHGTFTGVSEAGHSLRDLRDGLDFVLRA